MNPCTPLHKYHEYHLKFCDGCCNPTPLLVVVYCKEAYLCIITIQTPNNSTAGMFSHSHSFFPILFVAHKPVDFKRLGMHTLHCHWLTTHMIRHIYMNMEPTEVYICHLSLKQIVFIPKWLDHIPDDKGLEIVARNKLCKIWVIQKGTMNLICSSMHPHDRNVP